MNLDFNILKLFSQGNGLLFLGAVIFILGLLMFLRQIINILNFYAKRSQPLARRMRLDLDQRILFMLISVILALLGTSLLLGGITMRTYVSFTRADQVGSVECLSWNAEEKFMVVSMATIEQGKIKTKQTFSLYGDQWEISAHILKWDPKVNLLGLHTGYRLNQIKGIYLDAEDETKRLHRAYAITPGKDWLWWALSRFDAQLPMVEAVYGNAVSQIAKPGDRFDIFVTTSGLSARRYKSK
ncbi:hypothetical protein KAR34_09565 [bacterium]|nr:hypothetical protein [bacterium]